MDSYPLDSSGSRPNLARVRELRDVRDRLVDAGVVVVEADGQPRELFPVAIGRGEGLALCDWVRRERSRRTLEVGLGFAIATLFICEGLLASESAVRHVAIDAYQNVVLPRHKTSFAGSGLAALETAGGATSSSSTPRNRRSSCPGSSPRAAGSTSRSSTAVTASKRCSST